MMPVLPPLRFQGKVALITGGSRGLGFLLARDLGRAGCRVAICGRDQAALDWAQRQLAADGIRVLARPCEVGNREQVEGFVEETRRELGPIDVLVNNAGIMEVGPVQHMRYEDFQAAMAVMFWGPLHTIMAVYPEMIERGGGAIVNITSVGGKVSVPHLLPYCSAKFAAVGLSEGLRAELGSSHIRVLTVVPGLMRTGSYLNAFMRSQPGAEFAWFGLGASLPGISMDAERAARQIVRAIKWGLPEVTLGIPARLIQILNGLAPGLTTTMMGLVNRLVLPRPGGAAHERARGQEAQAGVNSRLFDLATALGRAAAERFQPNT